jgi:2-C-methyl-D-erythritol 4-phosphate cytidylyltransferase
MGGVKKEYCPLPSSGGLTVLGAAVSAFAEVPAVKTIVIAVPADAETGEAAARKALPPELLEREGRRLLFVPGGKSRRMSVHHALALLAARPPCYVLIHDGGRPWVNRRLVERVIAAVKKYRAVIPLLPLTDTPKETSAPLAGFDAEDYLPEQPVFIERQLRRARTGAAQTPQAFAFSEILAAHEKAAEAERSFGAEFTDDAEVWGAFCGPVAVIPGAPENRKITFPGDLG